MVNIKNLIKKDKWDEILKYIKQDKINLLAHINGSILIHIASAKDKKDILRYVSKNNPNLFKKLDKNGDTPLHVLANYGYYDTLYEIIKKDKYLINLKNRDNQKISDMITIDGDKESMKILRLSEGDNSNLLKIIDKSIQKKDKYNKILLKALKDGNYDLNSKSQNPLIYAILKGKKHIVDILLKYDANINIINDEYMSPLILSIINDETYVAEKLINKGADINYGGAESDFNPLVLSILKGNSQIFNLLLDQKPDFSITNRYLDTPIHVALSDKKLNISDIFRLIYYSDMNQQNIHGNTPLHLLIKNYDWRHFEEILKTKDLNMNVINKKGKKPIDYIQKDQVSKFASIVDNASRENTDNTKNIQLVTGIKTNLGMFNADAIHNMIYTVLILNSYPQVTIPNQQKTKIKYVNDRYELQELNLYKEKKDLIIADLQKIYTDFAYEIIPYLIVWGGVNRYFIHKDIEFYLTKALDNPKIRFVFMKLTIVTSEKSTHANILIYDKKNNMMERFEPYGVIPYVDNDQFDMFLKKLFTKILPKLRYLSPKELMGTVSFQVLSDDTNRANKNLGDPYGYCLAWTYWYLEMRLANPDTDPKDMIKKSIKHILNYPSSRSGSDKFLGFIRDYAKKLDNLKNKFMLDAGVKQKDLYNLVQNKDNESKITERLTYYYNKL